MKKLFILFGAALLLALSSCTIFSSEYDIQYVVTGEGSATSVTIAYNNADGKRVEFTGKNLGSSGYWAESFKVKLGSGDTYSAYVSADTGGSGTARAEIYVDNSLKEITSFGTTVAASKTVE